MALPMASLRHPLRSRRHLIALGLIELQGDDLRDKPLEQRKQRLAKMLASGGVAITYNEHLAHDGAAVFEHPACWASKGLSRSGSIPRTSPGRQSLA